MKIFKNLGFIDINNIIVRLFFHNFLRIYNNICNYSTRSHTEEKD